MRDLRKRLLFRFEREGSGLCWPGLMMLVATHQPAWPLLRLETEQVLTQSGCAVQPCNSHATIDEGPAERHFQSGLA